MKNLINNVLSVQIKVKTYNYQDYSLFFLTLFLFFFWYLILGYKLLDQGFIWDDHHIIRSFSSSEIKKVWVSNWIPDGNETPSYRPFATLIYHLQGTLFKEDIFLQRIFLFLLAFLLLYITSILFSKLGFNNKQNFFLIFLIIFSKVFTTLNAWLTMSQLFFFYICYLCCLIFFINYLKSKKKIQLCISLFFFLLGILTRENGYTLPLAMLAVYIYFSKSSISINYFNNYLKIFFLTFSLVALHYTLRKFFVENAAPISINFRSYFNTVVFAFFPGGFKSFSNLEYLSKLLWIIFNISIFFLSFKKVMGKKKDTYLFIKKIFFFASLILICSLPGMVSFRNYDLFLSTIFYLAIITKMIYIIFENKFKNYIEKILVFMSFTIFAISLNFFYLRSKEHLISMNQYSAHIIFYNVNVFFGKHEGSLIIPEKRRENQIKILEDIGIYKYLTLQEILDMKSNMLPKTEKIIIPKFKPLDH